MYHPASLGPIQNTVRELVSGPVEGKRTVYAGLDESPVAKVFLELDPRHVKGKPTVARQAGVTRPAYRVEHSVPEALRALVITDPAAYPALRRDPVLNRVFDFEAQVTTPEHIRVPVREGFEPLPEGLRKPLAPDRVEWAKKGGTWVEHGDGSVTYSDWEGNSVFYDADGYADFEKSGFVVDEVKLDKMTGENGDFAEADRKYAEMEKMRRNDQTWHHSIDGKTMQLVDRKTHARFSHTGGASRSRARLDIRVQAR